MTSGLSERVDLGGGEGMVDHHDRGPNDAGALAGPGSHDPHMLRGQR